jgi:hypothetical protein
VSIVVRPIHTPDALARLEERLQRHQQRAVAAVPQNGETFGIEFAGVEATEEHSAKLARAAAEADVVDAARRSQAEIRRHVDSYLKEHFEGLVAAVTSTVIAQVTARVMSGITAQQESQQIALDRIAADVRAQLRAYTRGVAQAKPKKGAKRESKKR